MDFDLTEDQRAFQATARNFARDEMMPHARDWDEGEIFPVDALRRAAQLGFGGIAGTAMEAAKLVFFVAIVLFAISAVIGLMRGRSPTL